MSPKGMSRVLGAYLVAVLTWFLAVVYILFSAGCAHPAPQVPAAAPQLVAVRFSPKGFRMAPMAGSEAFVMVTIPAGTPLWCPVVDIDWGVSGFTSSHEEDCDPADAGQAYSYSRRGPAKMTYWRPSVVRVWIHQGQAEVRFEFDVRVQGVE